MQDCNYLSSYSVYSGATISVAISLQKTQSQSQALFIKNMNGKTYTVYANPDEYIQNVKSSISSQSGDNSGSLMLVYNSKQLQDGHRLSEYNVAPNSTIYMTVKLHGGF